ncbi:PREDICTED: uncharacterized protein LOC109166667 [Ipomoea nil]|uniref:uncharacterized protein LOC109166667 n=1 Tax=Ipomoea nil TaxID=35883 RepID=UPI000901B93C|nr:PREDICTED: uncharacterized protein LOC109166667 [Ipomoea nil]
MVRTRNQRQGRIPRKGATSQYAGKGAPSDPVCLEEEDTTTIMDPVPISQVPFSEIQNPNPGIFTVDLHGDLTISPSVEVELRENAIYTQEEEEQPTIDPPPPPSLSDKEQRKKKRADPYEGADPRAKRPSDFPISARPPRRTPNIPPPRQNNAKKQRRKIIEEEQDWTPDSVREETECGEEIAEKKKKKLTAKDKGKQKVVSDADLSKLPKPYSSKFLTKENAKRWNKFVDKKVISQKLLVLDKLENSEQITEAITKTHLLGSVINIDPYDEQAVKEFYCNLTKGSTSPNNPMYEKAYLRGKFYDFNPEIINAHLGTPNEEQKIQIENEQIIQELTAGNVSFDKNKVKVASLTSKYAILQKIALVNWMPSLHKSTIKRSLAELLYKIGKGIQVNLGDIVYSQITKLAEGSETKALLIFPNLIHAILVKQGLKTQGPKTLVKTINTTTKLKKGSHQNDLKTSSPTDDPTDRQTLVKYFEKRLRELNDTEKQLLRKHMEIKEEKSEVQQWLEALKTESNEESKMFGQVLLDN